jgi:hypothetical protein
LRGLWGSQFSRASDRLKRGSRTQFTREVVIDFGLPISKDTSADVLKRAVIDLSQSSWQEYADNLPTLGELWIDTAAQRGNPVVLAGDSSACRPAALATAQEPMPGTRPTAVDVHTATPLTNLPSRRGRERSTASPRVTAARRWRRSQRRTGRAHATCRRRSAARRRPLGAITGSGGRGRRCRPGAGSVSRRRRPGRS